MLQHPIIPGQPRPGQVPAPDPVHGAATLQTWLAQAVTAHVFVSLIGL